MPTTTEAARAASRITRQQAQEIFDAVQAELRKERCGQIGEFNAVSELTNRINALAAPAEREAGEGELQALRDFARRVVSGQYGPTLAQVEIDSLTPHQIMQLIDSDLRQEAKRCLASRPAPTPASGEAIVAQPASIPCPDCGGTGGYSPAYVAGGEIVGPDACATCQGYGEIPATAAAAAERT